MDVPWDIFMITDNAVFIFDPRRANSREIYGMLEELCQFEMISLYIASRIVDGVSACHFLRLLRRRCEVVNVLHGVWIPILSHRTPLNHTPRNHHVSQCVGL